MSEELHSQILSHLKSEQYRPLKPRRLAKELALATDDEAYHSFRDALRELVRQGRVVWARGAA